MPSGRRLVAGALGAAAVFGGGESAAQEAGYAVRVVAADGTAGQVLGGPPVAFGPAWAPDGGRIGFIAVPAGAERGQIFSAAPDGSGLAQLSAHAQGGRFRPPGGAGAVLAAPTWSPDARRIAFGTAPASG